MIRESKRQALWTALRGVPAGEAISTTALARAAGASDGMVRYYTAALLAAGLAERWSEGWTPTAAGRRHGATAPRVKADGSLNARDAYARMWQAIRTFGGSFRPHELAAAAAVDGGMVSENVAARYCRHLASAGYLRRADGGVYAPVPSRLTGPKAPRLVIAVYDPNTGEITGTRGYRE